ncbi:MAG TPA: hypothetical protein VF904_20280 [Anaeromyxobacteraceae bacterium]
MLSTRCSVIFALVALGASPARAIDRFEIQVYEGELNEPGHLGLELHTNYTARGERAPAYAGEIAPDRTARLTLEPAYGVASWLEVGAYLQLLVAPATGARYAGNKLRVKMLAPKLLGNDFFLGVNVEVGRVPVAVEQDQWANELRPFIGYQSRWVLVDLNPIIGYALSGKDRFRPVLEPAAKLAVNTQLGFAVGAEYYAELGFVDALLPLRDQAHYLFGVVDVLPAKGRPDSPWELNLAVGGGMTRAADQQVIVKTIVGRGF